MGPTVAPPWQPENNTAGVTKHSNQYDKNNFVKCGILSDKISHKCVGKADILHFK